MCDDFTAYEAFQAKAGRSVEVEGARKTRCLRSRFALFCEVACLVILLRFTCLVLCVTSLLVGCASHAPGLATVTGPEQLPEILPDAAALETKPPVRKVDLQPDAQQVEHRTKQVNCGMLEL